MIDAKKELQYRLAIRMLEHLSEKGLLSAKELAYAKGTRQRKIRPADCSGIVLAIPRIVW